MSTNIRRNLVATITPQEGEPLTLELVQPERITTISTGIVATVMGRGGAGGYVYSVVAGTLPTNITLLADGSFLVGGALTIGTSNFTIEVQDSASTIFQHTFNITVFTRLSKNLRDPYCTPGEYQEAYSYLIRVNGNTGTMSYAVSAGSLPGGLSMSGVGLITGLGTDNTPPYVRSDFTVTGTDSGSGETIDIPCSISMYPEPSYPTGVFVPDGYLFQGYVGDLGDVPPIVQGQAYELTWAWNQYAPGPVIVSNQSNTIDARFRDVLPGVPGTFVSYFTAEDTAALPLGNETIRVKFVDAFGATHVSDPVFVQIVALPVAIQNGLTPQKNAVSVGVPGALYMDFAGAGFSSVTNSAGVITVTVNAGAGGVTSVGISGNNGIGVSGSPVTGSGVITLSLGNITPTSVSTGALTASGAISLPAGSITHANIVNSAGLSVIGRAAASSGAVGDITSTGARSFLAASSANTAITFRAIELADLPSQPALSVIGNNSNAAAAPMNIVCAVARGFLVSSASNTSVTFRVLATQDFPGGNWIGATSGTSYSSATTSLAADSTWYDTGASVSLVAGTYLVTSFAHGFMRTTASTAGVTSRLYNVTDAAAVTNSECCILQDTNAVRQEQTGTISMIITVAATKSIRLEASRLAGGTYSVSPTILSNTGGRSGITYVRLY